MPNGEEQEASPLAGSFAAQAEQRGPALRPWAAQAAAAGRQPVRPSSSAACMP